MIIKWHLLLIRSTALAGEINRLQGRGALQADVFFVESQLFFFAEDRHYL